MKIETTIVNHLAINRRLTIPKLGTLIVSLPEEAEEAEGSDTTSRPKELLFSEFLKDDDGVLRGLLMAEGASEIAAAGAIDRLKFEILHATGTPGGEYAVEGLGVFKRDDQGALTLSSEWQPVEVEAEPQPQIVEETRSTNWIDTITSQQTTEETQVEEVAEEQEVVSEPRATRLWSNIIWLVVPLVAAAALLIFVGYVVIDQWRLGFLELPDAVEDVLLKIYEIVKGE